MTMTHRPYHFVAIVGGAIAGSVAAEILADNGIHVVVIEQNKKPYGKIEDGLPRWASGTTRTRVQSDRCHSACGNYDAVSRGGRLCRDLRC